MKTKTSVLGKTITGASENLDAIQWSGGSMEVELNCSEFTSHCPVTGQPDFGRVVIRYQVNQHIVETKSLKMWLWTYRTKKQFNEAIADEMAHHFMKLVKPKWVEVVAHFNPRGGIAVKAIAFLGSR